MRTRWTGPTAHWRPELSARSQRPGNSGFQQRRLLYVVTEPPAGSATNWRQLVVMQHIEHDQVHALDIATSVGSDVRLAVASDDRLMVLVGHRATY